MSWPASRVSSLFLDNVADYCEPGLRSPLSRSISDTDGKAVATGSLGSGGLAAAGGGFAAAVVETGAGSRAGGATEAGGGNAASVADGAAGGAVGAAGGEFFDSLSRSTSDCEGKASVAYSTEEEDEQETSNGSVLAATRTRRRAARARSLIWCFPSPRFVPTPAFITAQAWRQSDETVLQNYHAG